MHWVTVIPAAAVLASLCLGLPIPEDFEEDKEPLDLQRTSEGLIIKEGSSTVKRSSSLNAQRGLVIPSNSPDTSAVQDFSNELHLFDNQDRSNFGKTSDISALLKLKQRSKKQDDLKLKDNSNVYNSNNKNLSENQDKSFIEQPLSEELEKVKLNRKPQVFDNLPNDSEEFNIFKIQEKSTVQENTNESDMSDLEERSNVISEGTSAKQDGIYWQDKSNTQQNLQGTSESQKDYLKIKDLEEENINLETSEQEIKSYMNPENIVNVKDDIEKSELLGNQDGSSKLELSTVEERSNIDPGQISNVQGAVEKSELFPNEDEVSILEPSAVQVTSRMNSEEIAKVLDDNSESEIPDNEDEARILETMAVDERSRLNMEDTSNAPDAKDTSDLLDNQESVITVDTSGVKEKYMNSEEIPNVSYVNDKSEIINPEDDAKILETSAVQIKSSMNSEEIPNVLNADEESEIPDNEDEARILKTLAVDERSRLNMEDTSNAPDAKDTSDLLDNQESDVTVDTSGVKEKYMNSEEIPNVSYANDKSEIINPEDDARTLETSAVQIKSSMNSEEIPNVLNADEESEIPDNEDEARILETLAVDERSRLNMEDTSNAPDAKDTSDLLDNQESVVTVDTSGVKEKYMNSEEIPTVSYVNDKSEIINPEDDARILETSAVQIKSSMNSEEIPNVLNADEESEIPDNEDEVRISETSAVEERSSLNPEEIYKAYDAMDKYELLDNKKSAILLETTATEDKLSVNTENIPNIADDNEKSEISVIEDKAITLETSNLEDERSKTNLEENVRVEDKPSINTENIPNIADANEKSEISVIEDKAITLETTAAEDKPSINIENIPNAADANEKSEISVIEHKTITLEKSNLEEERLKTNLEENVRVEAIYNIRNANEKSELLDNIAAKETPNNNRENNPNIADANEKSEIILDNKDTVVKLEMADLKRKLNTNSEEDSLEKSKLIDNHDRTSMPEIPILEKRSNANPEEVFDILDDTETSKLSHVQSKAKTPQSLNSDKKSDTHNQVAMGNLNLETFIKESEIVDEQSKSNMPVASTIEESYNTNPQLLSPIEVTSNVQDAFEKSDIFVNQDTAPTPEIVIGKEGSNITSSIADVKLKLNDEEDKLNHPNTSNLEKETDRIHLDNSNMFRNQSKPIAPELTDVEERARMKLQVTTKVKETDKVQDNKEPDILNSENKFHVPENLKLEEVPQKSLQEGKVKVETSNESNISNNEGKLNLPETSKIEQRSNTTFQASSELVPLDDQESIANIEDRSNIQHNVQSELGLFKGEAFNVLDVADEINYSENREKSVTQETLKIPDSFVTEEKSHVQENTQNTAKSQVILKVQGVFGAKNISHELHDFNKEEKLTFQDPDVKKEISGSDTTDKKDPSEGQIRSNLLEILKAQDVSSLKGAIPKESNDVSVKELSRIKVTPALQFTKSENTQDTSKQLSLIKQKKESAEVQNVLVTKGQESLKPYTKTNPKKIEKVQESLAVQETSHIDIKSNSQEFSNKKDEVSLTVSTITEETLKGVDSSDIKSSTLNSANENVNNKLSIQQDLNIENDTKQLSSIKISSDKQEIPEEQDTTSNKQTIKDITNNENIEKPEEPYKIGDLQDNASAQTIINTENVAKAQSDVKEPTALSEQLKTDESKNVKENTNVEIDSGSKIESNIPETSKTPEIIKVEDVKITGNTNLKDNPKIESDSEKQELVDVKDVVVVEELPNVPEYTYQQEFSKVKDPEAEETFFTSTLLNINQNLNSPYYIFADPYQRQTINLLPFTSPLWNLAYPERQDTSLFENKQLEEYYQNTGNVYVRPSSSNLIQIMPPYYISASTGLQGSRSISDFEEEDIMKRFTEDSIFMDTTPPQYKVTPFSGPDFNADTPKIEEVSTNQDISRTVENPKVIEGQLSSPSELQIASSGTQLRQTNFLTYLGPNWGPVAASYLNPWISFVANSIADNNGAALLNGIGTDNDLLDLKIDYELKEDNTDTEQVDEEKINSDIITQAKSKNKAKEDDNINKDTEETKIDSSKLDETKTVVEDVGKVEGIKTNVEEIKEAKKKIKVDKAEGSKIADNINEKVKTDTGKIDDVTVDLGLTEIKQGDNVQVQPAPKPFLYLMPYPPPQQQYERYSSPYIETYIQIPILYEAR